MSEAGVSAISEPATPERVFKVVFVGDSGVGKSSFIHRFCHDAWKPSFTATIGNTFFLNLIIVNTIYLERAIKRKSLLSTNFSELEAKRRSYGVFLLTWLAAMHIDWNEQIENVYIRGEFQSRRIGLGHGHRQHGRHFIVLWHQYYCHDVMWRRLFNDYNVFFALLWISYRDKSFFRFFLGFVM